MQQKPNIFLKSLTEITEKAYFNALKELTNGFSIIEKDVDSKIDRTRGYVKEGRTRVVWTPLGDVTFNRRVYELKAYKNNLYVKSEEKKFITPADAKLGLDKKNYFNSIFYPNVINELTKFRSYRGFCESYGNRFSPTLVSRILKKQTIYFKSKRISNRLPVLYINVDGFGVNKHKGKQYEMKFVVMYTGIKQGKRNKLENRTLLPIAKGKTTEDIALIINKHIDGIYGEVDKVYIVGDGAGGITSLEEHLGRSERYIDQFHFRNGINKVIGKRLVKKMPSITKEHLLEITTVDLGNALMNFATDNGSRQCPEEQKTIINKVKIWHKSYQQNVKKGLICVTEGIQSHYVGSYLDNRASYSVEASYKISVIVAAKYNDGELSTDELYGMNIELINDPHATIDMSIYIGDNNSNMPVLQSTAAHKVKYFYSFTG